MNIVEKKEEYKEFIALILNISKMYCEGKGGIEKRKNLYENDLELFAKFKEAIIFIKVIYSIDTSIITFVKSSNIDERVIVFYFCLDEFFKNKANQRITNQDFPEPFVSQYLNWLEKPCRIKFMKDDINSFLKNFENYISKAIFKLEYLKNKTV